MGNAKVLENDSAMLEPDREEEAYSYIEKELQITMPRLGYIPYEMEYESVTMDKGFARIRYNLGGKNAFFVVSKYETNASVNYKSDLKYETTVENKWLNQKLKLYKEEFIDGIESYETQFVIDGVYYRLTAMVDRDVFIRMAESIAY